ncbi:MAG: hypothetical protein QOK36_3583 [Gaiellales bacterium]|nr:hypothetical protein [Gaiellales bacterium]
MPGRESSPSSSSTHSPAAGPCSSPGPLARHRPSLPAWPAASPRLPESGVVFRLETPIETEHNEIFKGEWGDELIFAILEDERQR